MVVGSFFQKHCILRKKASFLLRTLLTSEPGILQSFQTSKNELWEGRKKKKKKRGEKAADVWKGKALGYHLSGWRLGRAISVQQSDV